jgi:hypothetical protein
MIYSQNRGLKSKVSLILLANFVVERVNTQKIFETIARLKLTLHGGSIKLRSKSHMGHRGNCTCIEKNMEAGVNYRKFQDPRPQI